MTVSSPLASATFIRPRNSVSRRPARPSSTAPAADEIIADDSDRIGDRRLGRDERQLPHAAATKATSTMPRKIQFMRAHHDAKPSRQLIGGACRRAAREPRLQQRGRRVRLSASNCVAWNLRPSCPNDSDNDRPSRCALPAARCSGPVVAGAGRKHALRQRWRLHCQPRQASAPARRRWCSWPTRRQHRGRSGAAAKEAEELRRGEPFRRIVAHEQLSPATAEA